jgi:hypothetical protein
VQLRPTRGPHGVGKHHGGTCETALHVRASSKTDAVSEGRRAAAFWR